MKKFFNASDENQASDDENNDLQQSANKESESDDVSIENVSHLEAIEAIKTLMKYMSVSSLCSHSICTPSGVYV